MRKLSAIAAALVASLALGYVLPAYSILKRMTDPNNISSYSWRVEGSVSFYGASAKEAASALKLMLDGNELQVDGVVSLKMPGHCRTEVMSVDGNVAASVYNSGKSRVESTPINALSVANDVLCATVASRTPQEGEGRAMVERYLGKIGVDQRKTSLGRYGGKVAFVIGDPNEGKPSFWIYKDLANDRFAPARTRFTDAQGQAWDVRFLDYTSPFTAEDFPRVFEIWKGDELQLRFTALKGEPKAQLADKLF